MLQIFKCASAAELHTQPVNCSRATISGLCPSSPDVEHPKALLFDAARRDLTETGLRTKKFNLEVHQVPYGSPALSGCRAAWVLKWVRETIAIWPPGCPYGQTKPTVVTNGVPLVYPRANFEEYCLGRPGDAIVRGVSK